MPIYRIYSSLETVAFGKWDLYSPNKPSMSHSSIRIGSGVEGIEIIETGLRPGEKLYEELLVKTEELDKTENSLIFIERDKPLPKEDIAICLELLQTACRAGDDDLARSALKKAVPTYKAPDEVNTAAEKVLMRA